MDKETEKRKLNEWPIGAHVYKTTGYPFPGHVRSTFFTNAGFLRIVVEASGEDYKGMLHIFNPEQLTRLVDLNPRGNQ